MIKFKTNFCCAFLLIFFSLVGISQELKGTIFDENKKPIQGISVYLDGTTIGTMTDANGEFYIKSQKINTSMIISAIGYETIFVNDPYSNNNQKFYLTIKNESLQEIVIRKEPFTRKQKMRVFKTFFLGTTKAGKLCKITNEDDIDLEYDYKKHILTATSKNPVHIINSYLGYETYFDIYKMNIHFSSKSIKQYDVLKSLFLGTTLYKSTSENETFIKRRRNVYYGSTIHFFKNMTSNIWNKNNFVLFKDSFQTNPSEHFLITKENNLFKVDVLQNDLENLQGANVILKSSFKSSLNFLYNNNAQSRVIFSVKTFFIDDFGNNSAGDQIEFSGAISEAKIGDLLPMNYEPPIFK